MLIKDVALREDFSIKDLWKEQHPLMHTWFLLSSFSIFFITAFFIATP